MLLLRILLTLLLGSVGGWLFAEVLHSPLPWLIGSLLATVAATMLGVQKLWIPGWFRQAGLIVIGISLGLRMTPDIWQTMTDHIGLMLIATLLTVLISLLNAWIFYKMGKVDRVTAIFSNIPGGLSEMVTIGQSVGGNQQVISIFHSIRAVTIVLCTPFLISWLFDGHASSVVLSTGGHVLEWLPTILLVTASLIGALVATRCSIPAPYLLGPLLIAALVSLNTPWTGENPALAGGLVKAAQVWIGVSIGLGFRKENIRKKKAFFPARRHTFAAAVRHGDGDGCGPGLFRQHRSGDEHFGDGAWRNCRNELDRHVDRGRSAARDGLPVVSRPVCAHAVFLRRA